MPLPINPKTPSYATAFEEGADQEDMDTTGAVHVPSYITAADTVSTANNNPTFMESAMDTAESVYKFIGVAAISGAAQLYNTPMSIGNLFTNDAFKSAEMDPGDVISSLDSDLGKFYQEHKESADVAGFMLSSLVPGTAGVKLLNAGQKGLRALDAAGKLGTNLSRATKLLAPEKQTYLAKAVKDVLNNASVGNFRNREAIKALAAGFGQNALEATAFETAVVGTMQSSPVLDNYDLGDFVSNIAVGAGLFGGIATAFDAAKIGTQLTKAADKAAVAARPWQHIPEYAKISAPDEKLAIDYESLNGIPEVPTNVASTRYVYLKQAAKAKETTLQNRIRTSFGDIANGDQLTAELLYRNLKSLGVQGQQGAVIGLKSATRLSDVAPIDRELAAKTSKVLKGKATPEDVDAFLNTPYVNKYIKMWGDDAGEIYDKPLRPTMLSDTLKSGQSIKVKATKVEAAGRKYKFSMVPNIKAADKTEVAHFKMLNSDPMEANARHIWAMEGAPAIKATAEKPFTVHADDIPLLEKILRDHVDDAETLSHIKVVGSLKKDARDSLSGVNLENYVAERKIAVANRLLEKTTKTRKNAAAGKVPLTQEQIAAMVNIKPKVLDGELEPSVATNYSHNDMFAMESYQDEFVKKMMDSGMSQENAEAIKVWHTPQQLKATYDTTSFSGINNHVVENMAVIKEKQKLYQEGLSRAAANYLGEDYNKFVDITSDKVYSGAKPSGAGASRLAAANGDYGSLASFVESIGSTTTNTISRFKQATQEAMDPALYKLASNQEAAIEWSVLNANTRGYSTAYGLNEAGDALEPLAMLKYRKLKEAADAAGTEPPRMPTLNPDEPAIIKFQHPETAEVAKMHIERNGQRTTGLASIRAAQGVRMNRDPNAFYPLPVNTRDYPYFAIVKDDSVTSGNASTTIYANTAEELESMIRKARQNEHYTVLTKKDAENYYKAQGKWDYEKSINSRYIDTDLKRRGVSAPHIVATDPQKIVTDTLNWHMDREAATVREAVSAKYEVQFEELRRLGDEYTNIDTSQFSKLSNLEYAEDVTKNPFADYVRTALGIGKQGDYPFWNSVNQLADKAVSRVVREAQKAISGSKSQADLDKVNGMLKKAGYKGAAYDEEMEIFANAGASRGVLSKLVNNANSVLATVVLRFDALNAVNNAVSANVLLGAETSSVVRAIQNGDKEAVGALADLAYTTVPGTTERVMTPSKMIGRSILKYMGNDRNADMQFYRDNGFIGRITDQYQDTLEQLTYNPAAGVNKWKDGIDKVVNKMRKAGDAGEKYTGNKLAEEFNRFVAADVMKQLTDVAVDRGLMTGKEQLSYIRTFVNRTQGNYLASQRPNMFQGPVGQAIGLFQTYQFNLMQQLLRYVGEGKGKDAMTLMALQGTIHGLNGLPAFNAINTHIIGTASGNNEHKDIYTSVYGAVGKNAGDWLMYGMASNALGLLSPDLKVNLYTRGDINPRHLTVLPTDPSQVPIVQATARFMSNIKDTVGKIQDGGNIYNSILQGIEHNGLSRPLAGLAQTLEGFNNPEAASYSTSSKGDVVNANDLFSLTNLVRIVGGKPMDESVAIDAMYRNMAYSSRDTARREKLGEALKSKVIAGGELTTEDMESFMDAYVRAGGKQGYFNRWVMNLYKSANLAQTNKMMEALDSPYGRSMQRIMGGNEMRDFYDTPAGKTATRSAMMYVTSMDSKK